MATLFWLQTGACGGDSLAILSAESPSLEQLLQDGGVELLWHPSLSHGHARRFDQLVDAILAGEQPLDILCIEGSIITAPRGTGPVRPLPRPRQDGPGARPGRARRRGGGHGHLRRLRRVHAAPPNPSDCIGLQFDHAQPGGCWRRTGARAGACRSSTWPAARPTRTP
jgi:hydrogenase small subunit